MVASFQYRIVNVIVLNKVATVEAVIDADRRPGRVENMISPNGDAVAERKENSCSLFAVKANAMYGIIDDNTVGGYFPGFLSPAPGMVEVTMRTAILARWI